MEQMHYLLYVGKITSNVIVRSNIIYNNDEVGITIGGCDYPKESGKIIDSQILNNTTYNNNKTSNGIGGQTAEITIFYTENCIIQNNIFYGGNSASRLLSADNVNAINLNLYFNLYFGNMAVNFDFAGISYADFIANQAGTSQDANSIFYNHYLELQMIMIFT